MPKHKNRGRAASAAQQLVQLEKQQLQICKPPQVLTNVILRHKFRYIATGSSSFVVNPTKLAAAAGAMCTVANTSCTICYDTVRIRSIEVWSPAPSQGTAATATCLWNQLAAGISNMSTIEVSDTSMSTAYPAHIKTTPPKLSFAANWQSSASSTPTLCTLSIATGSIIDVEFEGVLADTGASGPSATVATGVLGTMYYLPLDGTTSHNVIPVQLSTTF